MLFKKSLLTAENKSVTTQNFNLSQVIKPAIHSSALNPTCELPNIFSLVQKDHHLSPIHCDPASTSCCCPVELNGVKIWIILSSKA